MRLSSRYRVGQFSSGSGNLFTASPSALSVGRYTASAFLTATGLNFSRNTISTVQTSDSTIDSTPAINEPCIGDRTAGTARGLVIQHNTKNLTSAPRDLNGFGWESGTGVVTSNYAAGPDGTIKASRSNLNAGQYTNYGIALSAARHTFSSWQRSTNANLNGSMQAIWITGAPGDGLQARRTASNVWNRLTLINGTVSRQYYDVADSRDFSASGGDSAIARDILSDFIQYEDGDFATEAIEGNLFRGNDVLSLPTGSSIVTSTGMIRFYAKIIPKFASTSQVFFNGSTLIGQSAAWYLFSWGANSLNYAKILDTDKKLYVKIAGGTEMVSTIAVTFSAFDVIEWDIQVGSNLPSVARYRKNGAAWIDLILAAINNIPTPGAGAIGLFYNDAGAVGGDSGQFPCWLQTVTFLSNTGSPPT